MVACTAFVVLAVGAAGGDKKEEKIPLDKVPKAVMDAVKARFPTGKIDSVTKEKDGDKIVYDIELKQGGRKFEMDILENGTVLEVEMEIAAKDLPKAVSKALSEKHPRHTIKEVMEVYFVKGKDEKLDHYEVTMESPDKKSHEVLVYPDGKFKVEEKK
jgi:hypothetical protein